MRILIYGAGAIGCIFGGMLLKSGYDVTLLARGSWKDILEREGLVLQDCLKGRQLHLRPRIIGELAPNERYDFVFVVMQAHQVEAVLPVLAGNVSPNVVFVVNNPLGYQDWIQALGVDRIMIGFPSAGGERHGSVVRYFIGTGLAKAFQSTTFGELDGSNTPRLKSLLEIFRRAGFSPVANRDMSAWQKTHVAVILPIAKALYRFDSDNYRLARDWSILRLMVRATREGLAVLRNLGVPVTPGKLQYYYLPWWLLVPVFSLVLGTRMAEFALAKHTVAAKDEMLALEKQFGVLVKSSGLTTPALDCLWIQESPPTH